MVVTYFIPILYNMDLIITTILIIGFLMKPQRAMKEYTKGFIEGFTNKNNFK